MNRLPRLTARFRPQAWIRDFAMDVDGAVDFDATAAFLALPPDAIRAFRENDYDSDHLADDLPEYEAHSGPFEVDVEVDDWLEALGFPNGRASLTDADVASIRERFAAEEREKRLAPIPVAFERDYRDEPCSECLGHGYAVFSTQELGRPAVEVMRCDSCAEYPTDDGARAAFLRSLELGNPHARKCARYLIKNGGPCPAEDDE